MFCQVQTACVGVQPLEHHALRHEQTQAQSAVHFRWDTAPPFQRATHRRCRIVRVFVLSFLYPGIASGWDDPRMPTLNGLRRRGYSAKTLNTFCDVIGVARRGGEVWTAVNVLEQCCREELDAEAQRRFVVVDPVKVTLTNVAADFVEHIMLPNNPRDESAGKRSVALCSTLYLERADFREDGAEDKDFYGLAPGKTVMLRCVRALQLTVSQRNITLDFICSYAFHISCTGVKKDAAGKVIHLHLHLLVNNTGMFANFLSQDHRNPCLKG